MCVQCVARRERKVPGMKSMAPSEEKELDEALGIATRVLMTNSRDLMIPNRPTVASHRRGRDDKRSPRWPCFHGVFKFVTKFRRQTSKNKSSADDALLPSVSNVYDELSAEEQEAYNVLVGQGLTRSLTTRESLSDGAARQGSGVK